MASDLKIQFPSHGWKQFLTARKEMLDAFDSAREKSRIHEVETFHGKVAESEFRKWLVSFLPKRFGVTSGYVVSQGMKGDIKTPHYDVIIYDQMDSPILWIEDFPDSSELGSSRAIPVEYVKCILEVKSTFSGTTVKDAIEHLNDLKPFMDGVDDPLEKYKLHLPAQFCCGLVFFDIKKDAEHSLSALKKVIEGENLRRFFGAAILRGEGHSKQLTGRINLLIGDQRIPDTVGKDSESLIKSGGLAGLDEPVNGKYRGAMLMWTESDFARLGFDLIAMMQGTYEVGRLSSFYGMGKTD